MCRWLAYTGEPIHPSTFVLDAEHSLVAQSLNSPLGAETVNGDGFGIGWYPLGQGESVRPAQFRSTEPAWNDQNLRELCEAVKTPMFLAHVRAAAGPPIQQTNCHPFRYDNWLFMHNGFLQGFPGVRRDLMLAIDPELFADVRGTTDTEVLFHLALTFGLQDDPIAAMRQALHRVEEVGRAHGVAEPVQGTFAVADGSTLWAFRYSSAHASRTLFHSADMATLQRLYPDAPQLARFGAAARVVVSEPLSALPGVFEEVPESSVAVMDADGYRHEKFEPAPA